MKKMKQAFLLLLFISTSLIADTSQLTAPKTDTYSSRLPIEGNLNVAMDSFHGIPDGSWEGNFGSVTSLNLRSNLPKSYSLQLGGSFGLYDWAGRTSAPFKNPKAFQQQGFITFSAAKQTTHTSGMNYGIAYDWMFNKNFGVFATNPYLSQVRAKVGYLVKGGNEFGAMASINVNTAHKEAQQIPLTFRAISQANIFWTHHFKNNSYATVWAGTPYRKGLLYTSGRAGKYIFGARFEAMLTQSLSINGKASYMGARSAPDGYSSKSYASDVSIGLTYSFGERKKAKNDYMSMADNSNFLVDTNQHQ